MEAAPISLYIDLESDQKADLEIVARASLAFAAAIKELCYILDPSLDVRVELASGTDGSLSLNSIIRAIKQPSKVQTLTVSAVATTVLIWFASDARTFIVTEALKRVVGIEDSAHLPKRT